MLQGVGGSCGEQHNGADFELHFGAWSGGMQARHPWRAVCGGMDGCRGSALRSLRRRIRLLGEAPRRGGRIRCRSRFRWSARTSAFRACGGVVSRSPDRREVRIVGMKRPARIPQRHPQSDAEVEEFARDASYVGSPEHKAKRWWGGRPETRIGKDGKARRPGKQLTTICPLGTSGDLLRATKWIREAIRQRRFRFVEGDKRFPSEAAPQTDKACTALPLGANLPEASYLSQPRTCRLETRFENLAQL